MFAGTLEQQARTTTIIVTKFGFDDVIMAKYYVSIHLHWHLRMAQLLHDNCARDCDIKQK